jgi:hypothetical protein
MLSPAEILQVARLYSAAEGVTLGTVGRRALKYRKIFERISAGRSANASSLIKLESFFRANWPAGAVWPAELAPRPRPEPKRGRGRPRKSTEIRSKASSAPTGQRTPIGRRARAGSTRGACHGYDARNVDGHR